MARASSSWALSIPHNPLRNIGVILIVLFQLYAALHLRQAALRMTDSGKGDPGALKPWIMLYEGDLAFFAARGAVLAPFAAASVTAVAIVTRLVKTDSIVSIMGLLTVSALFLSGALAWLSLRACVDLRRESRRHRKGPWEYGQTT